MSDRRTLLEHPLFRVEGWTARTRHGEAHRVRMRSRDWVNAVPLDEDGRVVLIRQHRWGIDASSLEIPGGIAEPGEPPLEAARRELAEETGYGGGTWSPLGWVWSNPAIQDNRTWMFLAEGVRPLGPLHLDPDEEIAVELHPAADVPGLLERAEIAHSLAVVALQRWMMRGRSL